MAVTQFTVNIELGNDAMQTPDDIARALHKIASYFDGETGATFPELGPVTGKILDLNGNTCGSWAAV